MASEMLKAVLEVEQECSQKESAAKKQAEADKQDAKQKAADIVAGALKQADKMLSEHEGKMAEETSAELDKAKADAKKECSAISGNAAKNRDRVTKLVVDMLTGN